MLGTSYLKLSSNSGTYHSYRYAVHTGIPVCRSYRYVVLTGIPVCRSYRYTGMSFLPVYWYVVLNGILVCRSYRYTLKWPLNRYMQGDQLNMAVFFWYLVESDLSSVYVYEYTVQ